MRRGRASQPALAVLFITFSIETYDEYYLKQLGSSDPYHPAHNSVYKL